MGYFDDCTSVQQAKSKFRQLAMNLHPDKEGGDQKAFVIMQNEYEVLLDMLPSKEADVDDILSGQPSRFDAVKAEKEFKMRVSKLVNELGLTIILSNDWIWIKKEEVDRKIASSMKMALSLKLKLMSLGFSYSKRLSAWYWFSRPPASHRTSGGRNMTLDEMFDVFGMEIKSPEQL